MTVATIDYAYARFARERFPLPTEAQLVALERRIGVTLPEDYRRFILEYNGGYFNDPVIEQIEDDGPDDELAYLSGIGALHDEAELGDEVKLAIFDDNDPPKIMVIGTTPMGSFITLDTAPGPENGMIAFKQDYGDFYYLADGIGELFRLLREPDEEGPL